MKESSNKQERYLSETSLTKKMYPKYLNSVLFIK